MPRKRLSPRLLKTATFLLLTFCTLSFSTSCKPKVVLQPVYIGEIKIVGKIVAGETRWEPGEDPVGDPKTRPMLFIVTDGYVKSAMYSLLRIRELELENASLKAALKGK